MNDPDASKAATAHDAAREALFNALARNGATAGTLVIFDLALQVRANREERRRIRQRRGFAEVFVAICRRITSRIRPAAVLPARHKIPS